MVGLFTACASSPEDESFAPPPAASAEAEAADVDTGMSPDEIVALEAELADYERRLAAAGVALPVPGTSTAAVGGASRPSPVADLPAADQERSQDARNRRVSSREQAPSANEDLNDRDEARTTGKKGGRRKSKKSPKRAANKPAPASPGVVAETETKKSEDAKDQGAAGGYAAEPTDAPEPEPRPDPALAGEVQQEEQARAPMTRCEELCALADAICALETKVCAMALRHSQEPRYAEACERATLDCTAATDACSSCQP